MTRPRARRRRSGSVVERQPGSFQARVSIVRPDGSRSSVSKTFTDPKLAAQWVSEMEVKKGRGEAMGQKWSMQPFIEFLREFYTEIRMGRKGEISRRTCQDDLALCELYLAKRNPMLAHTPLSKVTTDQLAKHFRQLSDAGREDGAPLAEATVSRLFRIVRARLAFAVKLKRIRVSPVDGEMIPVAGNLKKDQTVLTPLQARAFLTACEGERFGVLFAALLWTGCRPGELAGLLWRDTDFDNKVLRIQRALVRTRPTDLARGAGTSWALAPTKTKKARQIPIPDDLVQMLKRHKAEQASYRLLAGAEYENNDLVFPGEYGKPLYLDTIVKRYFKPMLAKAAALMLGRTLPPVPVPSRSPVYTAALAARHAAERQMMRDAEFPDLSLYSLRHSMATLLLQSGVHPKIVSNRLGHSTTNVTLEIYSHVSPAIQEQAVHALEESLGTRSRSA